MVIMEAQCKCGFKIKENGEYKFKDAIQKHLSDNHTEKWRLLCIARDNAQGEFEKLRDKYPELKFSYSTFDVDMEKALKL